MSDGMNGGVQGAAERREAPEAMTEAIVDAAAGAASPATRAAHAPPKHDGVDWWTDRLVEASELEAAVLDALSPERDALHAVAGPLRRLSLAAARGLATAQRAATQTEWGVADRALARAHARLAAAGHVAAVAVRDVALGDDVRVGHSRGFADDGLYPETYMAAARRLAAHVGPPRALVVGLRGIGAGLSAVVADTLARRGVDVRSVTVRPRGDRHERTLEADAALDAMLREAAATPGTWAVVVDEGPGETGASFAGTAAALAQRGFDDHRVVFVASRNVAADALASPAARERWERHRRFVERFEDAIFDRGDVRCHVVGHSCRLEAVPDAGGALAFRCAAGHEGDGPVRLTFVGLGHYGRARAAEARRRAEAGQGPRVLGLRRGFLITADGGRAAA